MGIYSGSGVLTAHYEYDAWGNVLEVTDKNGNAITSSTHIGNLNPFRYRGYYYDTESGLYYLMSRYYDPVTHRFINADGYFQAGGDILDNNMSAYCANNPIGRADPTGRCYEKRHESEGGTCWVIKTAIPGVPGFCNDCKCYSYNVNNVDHLYHETTIGRKENKKPKTSDNKSYEIKINLNTIKAAWPSSENYNPSQLKSVNEMIAMEVYNQSKGEVELNYFQKAQMFGEIIIHLEG